MRKAFIILLVWILIRIASGVSFANEVKPGVIPGGEFGLLYECGFPNTVEVDGSLRDLAWLFAPWHAVSNDWGTQPAPDMADASFEFAACADDQWLYVAIKVTDDKLQTGEDLNADLWKDDSVEIYIDPNNGKTATYETKEGNWDSQITIGAINIGGDINAPMLGGTGDGANTGTIAAVVETADGWDVESAVPLKSPGKWNIVPTNGMKIGFNVHLNDDDDGGDRDHKLIWSANDLADSSWENTSVFGELQFVKAFLSVDPDGKLATRWASVK